MKLIVGCVAALGALLVGCGSSGSADAGPIGGFDAGPQPECDAGWSLCGDRCIATMTDVQNCGSCENLCSVMNGIAGCTTGFCVIAGCDAGFMNCSGQYSDGCNVNITSDAQNCGGCNNVCGEPDGGGTPACSDSKCL